MAEVKVEQTERKEEQQKGTNWYLVAGVAAAIGVATVATVVVVQNGRKKRQTFIDEHSGFEDEIEWTEDTQYVANFFAATKRTFGYMWNRTVSGMKLVDKSIRNYMRPELDGPLASQAKIEEAQTKMLENDDEELYVGAF